MSFKYICLGSTVYFLILSVRGPSLDFRICRLWTSDCDVPRAETYNYSSALSIGLVCNISNDNIKLMSLSIVYNLIVRTHVILVMITCNYRSAPSHLRKYRIICLMFTSLQ